MPNLVPFVSLVFDLCRNLCFICMGAPLPEGGGVSNHHKNLLRPQKPPHAEFSSICLISSRVMQKFVFHWYGSPPFQTGEGSQTILRTFPGPKNPCIQIFTPIGSVVSESRNI